MSAASSTGCTAEQNRCWSAKPQQPRQGLCGADDFQIGLCMLKRACSAAQLRGEEEGQVLTASALSLD